MKTWYKKVSPPSIVLRFQNWCPGRDDDYRMDEIGEFVAGEGRGIYELLDWASKLIKQ